MQQYQKKARSFQFDSGLPCEMFSYVVLPMEAVGQTHELAFLSSHIKA